MGDKGDKGDKEDKEDKGGAMNDERCPKGYRCPCG